MNPKLESRLLGEVSTTTDMQIIPTLGRKWEVTKEPLDELERELWKIWLTLHSKTLNHGIWSHHLTANSWGKSGGSDRVSFLGLQNDYGQWWLVVQLLRFVQLSALTWTATHQDSPSLSISPEFAQVHVPWVDDTIQPSHLLPSSSPLAFSLSQNQGLFQWVSSSHQVAKVLELQLQHQSFQWVFRVYFF